MIRFVWRLLLIKTVSLYKKKNTWRIKFTKLYTCFNVWRLTSALCYIKTCILYEMYYMYLVTICYNDIMLFRCFLVIFFCSRLRLVHTVSCKSVLNTTKNFWRTAHTQGGIYLTNTRPEENLSTQCTKSAKIRVKLVSYLKEMFLTMVRHTHDTHERARENGDGIII